MTGALSRNDAAGIVESDGVAAISNRRWGHRERDLSNHASPWERAPAGREQVQRPCGRNELHILKSSKKGSVTNTVNEAQSGIREGWEGSQGPDHWLLPLGLCELGRENTNILISTNLRLDHQL